ncbi:zinc finger protein 333-like [Colias croceus]|uniref:zinc finger protein 333-like n=1 Tax=Colias crocea TaxID=72248 RepID=UPI001E27D0C3|nr:zinc finger protein 333-like [Colias croceus]
MEGICRGCLLKYNDSEFNTYSEKNRRLFVYSTGIQVKRNDAFTFQLCKTCYSCMKISCNFKKSCRTSDKKLKNFLYLKESGDSVDFSTFLVNDDSSKIRYPINDQYETLNFNKNKDDDNVSTSTSIRNFMKDILQGDEIPDNEARIISEVIKEEADISDNSLDSHWLQDDVSVDTEFRLDFSFSPFSTPRSIINDHCYTSQQTNHEDNEQTYTKGKSTSPDAICTEQNEFNIENDKNQEDDVNFVNNVQNRCVIDKNLENALKNDGTDNFSLDAILATPPMIPNAWAPSTPTINNILFGEKLEDVHKSGHNIEKFEEVEGTINVLDEFITLKDFTNDYNQEIEISNQETPEDVNLVQDKSIESVKSNHESTQNQSEDSNQIETSVNEPEKYIQESNVVFKKPLSPIENKCSIEEKYCKMCDLKLKTVRGLQLHMSKTHKLKVLVKSQFKKELMICDYCGKTFSSKKEFFIKHIALHMNPDLYRCNICSLTFSTEGRLRMHQSTHTGVVSKKPVEKKFICSICGACCSTNSNYVLHLRRHSGNYLCKCEDCGAGFYRKGDLAVHMRSHTGEKPFKCKYCIKDFARHATLNKHMKLHTGEKPFACKFCGKKFTTSYNLNVHQMRSVQCMQIQEKLAFSDVPVEN